MPSYFYMIEEKCEVLHYKYTVLTSLTAHPAVSTDANLSYVSLLVLPLQI